MNANREFWVIVKIFPKLQNPIESFLKVLQIRETFLQELKNVDTNKDYYFLHYTDVPEGPHFKFALKSKRELDKILDWRLIAQNNTLVKYIEILIEEDDASKNQASLAREIVENIDIDKIKQIGEIKQVLDSEENYKNLTDEGKHFVRNMMGLTYQDEILMRELK
ncbi:MAG: hypothetical protein Q8Q35_02665 [Nanoarchaeota archaeon]|nr:hypothetical protein [Nanoarchaeota archaeon]